MNVRLCLFFLSVLALPAGAAAQDAPAFAAIRGPRVVDALAGEAIVLEARDDDARWVRIVPRQRHSAPQMSARGLRSYDGTYANAALGGPSHGRWIGRDVLHYEIQPVTDNEYVQVEGARLRMRGVRAPIGVPPRSVRGVGTAWYARLSGSTEPSLLDAIPRKAVRVSFRSGNTPLDWLSVFFNVPYVFGSVPAQVNARSGVDCADALVAGWSLAKRRRASFTSVRGLPRLGAVVVDELIVDENLQLRLPSGERANLRWGDDVRAGDWVMIDFAGGRRFFHHTGALLGDSPRGRVGFLDAEDLLRHAGRGGLADQPLSRQGPATLRIVRPR